MKKILLYHSYREGGRHIIAEDYAVYREPGEDSTAHFPSIDELKRRALEEDRPELDKDRELPTRNKMARRTSEEIERPSRVERKRVTQPSTPVLELDTLPKVVKHAGTTPIQNKAPGKGG